MRDEKAQDQRPWFFQTPGPYLCNLQDNIHMPDLEEWKNWLTTNILSHILSSDITIEGYFQGSSSILLVTLPVKVWTMLPQIRRRTTSFPS
jgi:hypothetical protein